MAPAFKRIGGNRFVLFDEFYATSDTLNPILAGEDRKYLSPAAELFKRSANRGDITFGEIIEADILALMMAFISEKARWYPQMMYYARSSSNGFPFFLRASQHRNFKNLAVITGINDANKLREKVNSGVTRLNVERWNTAYFYASFWECMNMDGLDSIK